MRAVTPSPHKRHGEEGKDHRFVTALARGLAVLRAFETHDAALGNGEIAERAGLPKPTVSRMTFTLAELGYLNYSEQYGKYQLGPSVLSLGYSVLAGMEIREIARPFMQELADYAKGSVYLGVRDRLEMTYVEECRAPASMVLRLGVGSRIPIAATAMGRAFLAALPTDERNALIGELEEQHGESWPEVRQGLEKALKDAEEDGFAVTIGGWLTESNAAGVALRNRNGMVRYCINVGGLASVLTPQRLKSDVGPRLLEIARRIEMAAVGRF